MDHEAKACAGIGGSDDCENWLGRAYAGSGHTAGYSYPWAKAGKNSFMRAYTRKRRRRKDLYTICLMYDMEYENVSS